MLLQDVVTKSLQIKQFKMISFLLLSTLVCITLSTTCPVEEGWMQVGDSCYLVSTTKMSWYGAQEVRPATIDCLKPEEFCKIILFDFSFVGVMEDI